MQKAISCEDLKNLTTWIKISIYLGIETFDDNLEKLNITKCLEKEDDSFYRFLRLITANLVQNHAFFKIHAETVFDSLKNYIPKNIENIEWISNDKTQYKKRTICLAYFALYKIHIYEPFIFESYESKKDAEILGSFPIELKEKLQEFHLTDEQKLATNFIVKSTQKKKK